METNNNELENNKEEQRKSQLKIIYIPLEDIKHIKK